LLGEVERNLVEEYKDRAARAEAELANFRIRVERDRQANREAVIAEVIRALLPAVDDLSRAERTVTWPEARSKSWRKKSVPAFERFNVTSIGVVGERSTPTVTRQSQRFRAPTQRAKPSPTSSKRDISSETDCFDQPR
jgi:molecular chaperone GrpE